MTLEQDLVPTINGLPAPWNVLTGLVVVTVLVAAMVVIPVAVVEVFSRPQLFSRMKEHVRFLVMRTRLSSMRSERRRLKVLSDFQSDCQLSRLGEWGEAGRRLSLLAARNRYLTSGELAIYGTFYTRYGNGSMHTTALIRAASDPRTPASTLSDMALNSSRHGPWWDPLMNNPNLPEECKVLLALGANPAPSRTMFF